MRNITTIVFVLACLVLGTGCKEDKADYVRLSVSSFTFGPEGAEEYFVTVDARGKWGAEYNQNGWLTVEYVDDSTLKIGASPTRSSAMRSSQIYIKSGNAQEVIDLTQLGTNVIFTVLEQHSQEFVMSKGGKYIGAVKVRMEEGEYFYTPYIMNAQTGEKTEFETGNYMYDAAAVSDDGVFALGDLEGSAVFFDAEGALRAAKLPEDFSRVVISDMSADGTVFVGYGRNQKEGLDYPIKWVNNEPEILDVPRYTAMGADILTGVFARGCSADGSVIYGSIADDWTALYWRSPGASWEYAGGQEGLNFHTVIIEDYLGQLIYNDVVDRPILTAESTNMSSSGRYLATTYAMNVVVNRVLTTLYYPAIVDLETGKLSVIDNLPDGYKTGWGRTASDRGHLCMACPKGSSWVGYVSDYQTGEVRTITNYLNQEFGFMLQHDEAFIISYVGQGESILGATYLYEGSNWEQWYMKVIN